ncbi:MAG: hypothetical protein KJ000_04595 [Pirellulaceae bacterium]|nr:hypothetical protein [Pirellulaceae bacterium]
MNAITDRSPWLALHLCVLGVLAITAPTWADVPSEADVAVKNLLDVGWRTTPDARQQIDERFAAVPDAVRADARVAYAYALSLVRLRREADAARVIAPLAAAKNPPLGVLRAQLWLTMLTRQYDAALVQMERLAAQVAAEAADPPLAEHRETGRRMGMMIGFLETPAEGSVPPAKLEDYRNRIAAALPPTLADGFAEGRQAVKQQHAQWLAQQNDAEAQADEQTEAERQRLLDSAKAERDQAAVRRRELAEQLQKLREELGSEMETLQASERPLAEQLTVAVLQGRRVQDELLGVLDEIARLSDLLRRTRDPEQRRLLLIEIDRLERIAARIRLQVDQMEREVAILEARVLEIRQRAEATRVRYGREIASRENEQKTLTRRESQLTGMEQRAVRMKSGRGQSRSLAARAAALSTYVAFPLEEEKQRLLATCEQ